MSTEPLTGLTAQEVAERVERGRANTRPPRSGRTTGQIVSANVFTRINAILFVLFVIVMTTGHVLQGAFGLLIIANASIGIIQELRAKRTLDSLAVVGEAHPVVIRDGVRQQVAQDDVVVDDLIVMVPGDQIVVDGRVVAADYLEVDESLLTGEADPIPKKVDAPVLSGSHVVSGSGVYSAEKVGADAYAAQITAQASKFTLVKSELRQGIDKILKVISYLLVPVAALSIFVNFQQEGTTWRESVLRATASLVPMVPEGLVLLTSMAFALGVIRLGRRNVLVQELPAIEGLARVSVVCVDKTGTLTQNAMHLVEILPINGNSERQVRDVLSQLVAAEPAPNASLQGIAAGVPAADQRWGMVARAPFTSAKKWAGASFGERGDWLLGAPEILTDGPVVDQAEEISATGHRVLLLARAGGRVDQPDAIRGTTPIALLVLGQMVRPDAAGTLEYFAEQDMDVKVISGDNAASVGAVARKLGLPETTAVDARRLPPEGEEFEESVRTHSVFGRVTPFQKRRFVTALKRQGETVAMTGDGVNDVLALKDADLGVAMGSGAAATRSVAQLVLLDDRFANLPHVVAEGRRVIGNIERVAKLFLTKTIYAVFMALTIGLMGLPSPFVPLQMTIVGWFTIGIPAFLLSLAPNRDRARPGFVRRVLAVGVPCGITVGLVAVVTYVITHGFGPVADDVQTQASTATLAALIITATWVLGIVSRPWVTWRLGLVVFGYLFYAAMFLWPFSRRILTLDISNLWMMEVGILAGLIGAGVVEAIFWVGGRIRGEQPRLWKKAPPWRPQSRKAAVR